MKIALVHDGIFCRAGGERVLLNFHHAFPEAPIYTGIYDPDHTYPEFGECEIITSQFQRIAKNEHQFKTRYFPLGIRAMENLDVTDFDVVLMSTTHGAKYVKTSPESLVIAYCFTPFRLAWNPSSYSAYEKSNGLKRWIFDLVVKQLRKIDFKHAQRIDRFVAMTKETKRRLEEAYEIESDIPVFNPPIDTTQYKVNAETKDYYLVVSRLEKYKRVDLVIEAFNQLRLPLIVVGRGVEKENLKKLAGPTVEFREGISDEELSLLYQQCKGFIFPQHEDYGLTPLEAIACGRPVLAYGHGGVLETMLPYDGDQKQCTAVFFQEQTKESMIAGLQQMESLEFDREFIRRHAEKFDNKIFEKQISDYVIESFEQHKEGPTPSMEK